MGFIFIPGIKGSTLYDGEKRIWFPKNIHQLRAINYTNKLSHEEILSTVTAFGIKRWTVEIYKGLLESFPQNEMDIQSYDWRKSIDQVAKCLADHIKELVGKTGEPINIVAHSMGGMIAKLAIHVLEDSGRADHVQHLITAGTPWHGSPDSLKTTIYGEPGIFEEFRHIYKFIDKETTQKLARQFPSVYQLIPSKHYYNLSENGKFYLTSQGDTLPYDDVLKLIQKMYHEETAGSDNVYTKFMKPVHDMMVRPFPKNVRHDCLVSYDVLTLYKVPARDHDTLPNIVESRARFKFSPRFGNGDGVVPVDSARLSDPQTTHYFIQGVKHGKLFSNPQVNNFVRWCLNGRSGAMPDRISTSLPPLHTELRRGKLAMVQCPIDLTVRDQEGRYVTGVFDPNSTEISPLAEEETIHSYSIGESNFFYIANDISEDLILNLESYDSGIADVSVQLYEEEHPQEVQFEAIPVNPGSTARLVIPASENIKDTRLTYNNRDVQREIRNLENKDIDHDPKAIPDIPKLSVKLKPVGESKKSYRKPVFSGSVQMEIPPKTTELLEQVLFIVDDKDPVAYHGPTILEVEHGHHTVKVLAKDKFKRPIPTIEESFEVDNEPPTSRIGLKISPDGMTVKLVSSSLGARTQSFYQIIDDPGTVGDAEEWIEYEESNEINIPWGRLAYDPTASFTIYYFSSNEFGQNEETNSIRISLGAIPALMWEDTGSYVTPSMIFSNLFSNTVDIEAFTVFLIRNGLEKTDYNTSISDNARGVKFVSQDVVFEVMFSERYSLYFNGPPTEVLEVGKNYEFSFQLLTDRTKEKVISTSPRARLHRVVRGRREKEEADNYISLELKDGEFNGGFLVDESFEEYTYKLIITDQKNVDPPLRVVPLTLSGVK